MKKNLTFIISVVIVGVIVLFALTQNESFALVSSSLFAFLTKNFSWMYLMTMSAFVVFVIAIAFSKYGSIKLGKAEDKPEYSTFSWFAMLFCAGMGVGLVFWGISEPMSHYLSPDSVEPQSIEAVAFSFKSVFMHWGIHPWANYAVVGLAIAYFMFRKGKNCLVSSTLEPLVGEKNVRGVLGRVVDILAIFATVAGVVTSLGLGVLQINSGLQFLFEVPYNEVVQIIIIVVITLIFIASACSGINAGVKVLSNINLLMALFLILMSFIIGPKIEILNNMVSGLGEYLGNFVQDSLHISSYGDNSWIEGWRVFYWAWWIAWAPFVGVFIARISKGRTIREFIAGVVLAPTLASIVWFAILGTLGIHLANSGVLTAAEMSSIASSPETGLFIVFQHYPCGKLISGIAILLLCIFFITSADSGTFALSMLSSDGNLNPDNKKKMIWGIIQSVLAISLLLAGGLKPLQTISIVAAFPFMLVMICQCVSLVKSFFREK